MDINLIDLYSGGHHRYYLEILASFWESRTRIGTLRIFVPRAFRELHPSFSAPQRTRVEVVEIEPDESLDEGVKSTAQLLAADRAHGRVLSRVMENYDAHSVLMYFDHAQLSTASMKAPARSVSGIYFRPSFHYRPAGWRDRIRGIRKKLILRRAVRSQVLHRLFCLDPWVVPFVNELAGRNVAVELPDGVDFAPPTRSRTDQRRLWNVDDHMHVLLFFGILSRRKGILATLDALESLPGSVAERTVLVIAGRVSGSDAKEFERSVDAIDDRVQLIQQLGYVDEEEVTSCFDGCDTVLLPYQNHIGSSGVLIRAAARNRPVIGPDTGLMGRQIRNHRLGCAIDTRQPSRLRAAITQAVVSGIDGFDSDAAGDFARSHSAETFCSVFFSELGVSLT